MNFNTNPVKNEKMAYICNHEYNYFLKKPQVIGIGLGYKITNGFHTSKRCVAVFVVKKISKCKLSKNELIPKFFKGYPTDIIECGDIAKCQSLTNRIRPVLGGYSIGNRNNYTGGTYGCLVEDRYLYVLSAQHVLAIGNIGPIESPILQPAVNDGGAVFANTIGHLSRFIPIKYTERSSVPENKVDCGLCKVIKRSWVSPKIAFIGSPKGTSKAILNENVLKVGKTSELTRGIICYTNVAININCNGIALFTDQIATTRMTENGDSGSLLLNENYSALGLFIGATNQLSFANKIDNVLDSLKVKLVTS